MRIFFKYAYICSMKARVNLTIEESVLQDTKLYAEKHGTSVSEMVEDYLKSITKHSTYKKKSILELIEKLPKPNLDDQINYKEFYYKERAEKYGF
jgi:hypothetical protein